MVTNTWNLDIHLWKAERDVLYHFRVKSPRIFAFDFLISGTQINMLSMRCKRKVDFCDENMSNSSSNILMVPGGTKNGGVLVAKRSVYAVISGSFARM